MHDHLRRLQDIRIDNPIYFVTTNTVGRKAVLACDAMHEICRQVWSNCEELHGWFVGRYVLMPDHVHFFCASDGHATLSTFLGKWKEWTAKYARKRLHFEMPLWQPEFFDHMLRSEESYQEKWDYTRMNPVRASLVADPDGWPYQGQMNDL